MKFIRPDSLKTGDKVAILSPSSGMAHLFPWVYNQGLDRIREVFGLIPVEFPTANQSSEYLSKHPRARADDINQAFRDPSIKAIIATIGGNDQIRILPFLDKDLIASNPKIFMGYSDCTNLHLFLWNLGLTSFYGGAVMTHFAMGGGMHEYTIAAIKKAIFHPAIGHVYQAPEYSDADLDWADAKNLHIKRPIYSSDGWDWYNNHNQLIEGRLWGGCLEVLDLHLSVRKYLPDFSKLVDCVLFIETSEEMPTSGFVYRFIASLGELGLLNRLKAILVGIPKAQFCGMQPLEGRDAFIKNQQIAIKTALKDYDSHLPVIFNMNFGHTDPQMIIPNGRMARINCSSKEIEFL